MKTPEEIKKGLEVCRSDDDSCIRNCPYAGGTPGKICIQSMANDALTYIEQMEVRYDKMMFNIRGDCGVCKHRGCVEIDTFTGYEGEYFLNELCKSCLNEPDRPNWEYKGIPDIEK